ncbi:hypothetical protein QJS10_CPB22g00860 [Acorus calamus]|uniref:CCHC-type domain-containing protein n=1 Tax=Acorus calamus TaxID=4465 RepID=A0AAV9C207_ACOCL|nr:hypothetical protein QJS10_CPB22g00860 [Acorus calamus]
MDLELGLLIDRLHFFAGMASLMGIDFSAKLIAFLAKSFEISFDPSGEFFGLDVDLHPRNAVSNGTKIRSWFGPNATSLKQAMGIRTCRQCSGDCVIWEESIDEQPWEKARSSSPFKVKEDDEVDNLEIKLDVKRKSKRIYQSPSPEVGLKISRSLKILNAKTGLFSKRMKLIHGDPKLHAERVASIKKAKGTAEARKQASETMKAFFRDPGNRLKRSIAMKGVKFHCSNCGEEGHRKFYCPALRKSSKKMQFRCRLCGKGGHNQRTCEQSKSVEVEPESRKDEISGHHCSICRKPGHNRRTCFKADQTGRGSSNLESCLPNLIRRTRNRSYSCRLCSGKGHNIRTCPDRRHQLED